MFYLKYAVKVAKSHSVAVSCPDNDMFFCAMHHFKQLMFFDMVMIFDEFWIKSDQTDFLKSFTAPFFKDGVQLSQGQLTFCH